MSEIVDMDLAVASSAITRAKHLIEDNADKDDPTGDAGTLRRVYSLLLDAGSAISGAAAVIKQREEMRAILEKAATVPAPRLTLVK